MTRLWSTLFKILKKVTEVNYKLDLLTKIKIYLVQYIIILKLVYREYELLLYKVDIYKGHKEDKQEVQKVVNYQEIDNITQYKIKWIGFDNTIQELKENLNKAKGKIQKYYY